MTRRIYNRNRAVYLARRDAFFEKGKNKLIECLNFSESLKQCEAINYFVYLIRNSYEYAFLASKSTNALSEEESLLYALRSILQFAFALKILLEIESDITSPSSQLATLLADIKNIDSNQPDKINLSSLNRELLQQLKRFVEQAESAFSSIKDKNTKSLSNLETRKYQLSWQSVEDLLKTSNPVPLSFSTESLIPFSK